ncbi:MAG: DPP IV N-terminal domain-containing protein [Actinomycetota bacterium]|nr:DPP IV N-terminal domain-containing protein [Actinomycetota bacterium]
MTSRRFVFPNRAFAAALAAALAVSAGATLPAAAGPKATPTNGRIVFVGGQTGNADIYSINPDGTGLVNLTHDPGDDSQPAVSADGTKIAWISDRDAGNRDVYVMNADGTGVQRLTTDPYSESWPSFSPDGTRIVFGSNIDIKHDTDPQLYVMNADGSNVVRLTDDGSFDDQARFSPDGSKIAFTSFRGGDAEIYVMNADGSNQTNITHNEAFDEYPAWSPDGTLIAFRTNRDEDPEIYTMKPNGSEQTDFTNDHSFRDEFPAWSPDGTELAFTSNRGAASNPSGPADSPFPDDRIWVAPFPGGPAAPFSPAAGNEPVWAAVPHVLDLGLADPPDVGPLATGSKRRLSYQVTNLGNVDASGVTVQATLPHLLAFVSARRCTASGRVVTCQLGAIPAGDSDTVKFRVRVRRFPQSLSERTANVAIAVASSGDDAHPADNSQVQQVIAIHG